MTPIPFSTSPFRVKINLLAHVSGLTRHAVTGVTPVFSGLPARLRPMHGVACRAASVATARMLSRRHGGAAMNDTTNSGDIGEALAYLGWFWLLFWLFFWLICAAVAAIIAMDRDRNPVLFGLVTFFFLGPLGIAVALLATRGEMDQLPPPAVKRKVAEGRQRFTCPRCGAENDIPSADTSYDCWRCGEHRKVKPKVTAEQN
jgi:DNA-directed RNA polymerase subunit RPC12/RpoP